MAGIYMRFPGGKQKALTLSYDDGVEQDMRLMEIMKANGLKGTFNLNSGCYAKEGTSYPAGTIHRRMSRRQVTELYLNSGMEVAVHGLTHPALEQLPVNQCMKEIAQDRENLETQFDTIVRGMAYPYGSYSEQVMNCMRSCGIAYSRTVCSTGNFWVPNDWYQWNPTCHHNDERLPQLAKRFREESDSISPWLFYLWGHSYEFEEKNNWDVMERFAENVGNRDDIWYATNIELYDYIQAYRQLIFDYNATKAYNRTGYTLFFKMNDKVYTIAPNETIQLTQ